MAHDHCCSGKVSVPSVCQTLDELEFERGIWSAALNNEVDKMKDHIAKGVNPNLTDSSGYSPLVSEECIFKQGFINSYICKFLI